MKKRDFSNRLNKIHFKAAFTINGKPVDLHPPMTYQSPYLNGAFGSDKINVTVGPLQRVLDFSGEAP